MGQSGSISLFQLVHRFFCALVLGFLVLPILLIIPLCSTLSHISPSRPT